MQSGHVQSKANARTLKIPEVMITLTCRRQANERNVLFDMGGGCCGEQLL